MTGEHFVSVLLIFTGATSDKDEVIKSVFLKFTPAEARRQIHDINSVKRKREI